MNILVVSPKNTYAAKRLTEEALKARVNIKFASAKEIAGLKIKEYDVLYIRNPYLKASPRYLTAVVKLAKKFKSAGKKVVDSMVADGNLGQGKWSDYQKLIKANIPIPKTRLMRGREQVEFFPFILKWVYGMKGGNVFLARDGNQLAKILPLHPKNQWLFQEFIRADYEYKVVTVGYKALPAIVRFNMAGNGFKIDYYSNKIVKKSSIPKVVKLAERAAKVLGRELSKIDMLQKGNQLYVLEVNRFPGLDSFEELSKYNVFKAFLQYLQK